MNKCTFHIYYLVQQIYILLYMDQPQIHLGIRIYNFIHRQNAHIQLYNLPQQSHQDKCNSKMIEYKARSNQSKFLRSLNHIAYTMERRPSIKQFHHNYSLRTNHNVLWSHQDICSSHSAHRVKIWNFYMKYKTKEFLHMFSNHSYIIRNLMFHFLEFEEDICILEHRFYYHCITHCTQIKYIISYMDEAKRNLDIYQRNQRKNLRIYLFSIRIHNLLQQILQNNNINCQFSLYLEDM